MSFLHPIIAVTGSSGSGTTSVKTAFEHIFHREKLKAALVEGDAFHRHGRGEMAEEARAAKVRGERITHFGPAGNLFEELEALFREYSLHGTGKVRHYIHSDDDARRYGCPPGTFTEWTALPSDTDILLYEGLHGGLLTDKVNLPQFVDLLIGVVPIINLEWIQKINRDKSVRGYSREQATQMILDRMPDYINYIIPQFSLTDVNFQRVPTVDTSNPFEATDVPSNVDSMVVVHINNRRKMDVDFRYLLEMLTGSYMTRPDTIVIPAGKLEFAMEIIVTPVLERIMKKCQMVRAER